MLLLQLAKMYRHYQEAVSAWQHERSDRLAEKNLLDKVCCRYILIHAFMEGRPLNVVVALQLKAEVEKVVKEIGKEKGNCVALC